MCVCFVCHPFPLLPETSEPAAGIKPSLPKYKSDKLVTAGIQSAVPHRFDFCKEIFATHVRMWSIVEGIR